MGAEPRGPDGHPIDPETRKVGSVQDARHPDRHRGRRGAVWVDGDGGDCRDDPAAIRKIDPDRQAARRRAAGGDLGSVLNWGSRRSPSAPARSGPSTPTGRSPESTPTPAGAWRRSTSTPPRSRPARRACGSSAATTRWRSRRSTRARTGSGQSIRVGAQACPRSPSAGATSGRPRRATDSYGGSSPGRDPVSRSIDVGVGVDFLAFDAGAIWTANYSDGTVSRIDSSTNAVEATPVGAVQGLAAGEGTAWVSTAGATSADGAPGGRAASCSRAAQIRTC